MLYWSPSKTVKTTPGAADATDNAGVSGVMPLRPDRTLVSRTVEPAARSVRYRFGIPSGVAMKNSDRPSAENSGLVLRPDGKPARSEEHTSELQSPCNLVC